MSADDTWIWLPLANGSAARVDLADWPLVAEHRWGEAVGGKGAIACLTPKPHRRYVLLHRLIMGVSESKMVVRPLNGDVLDCRRVNLEVVTKAQANTEKRHTPRGAQFVGGWVWREVRRNGKAWRYALVTYRGRRLYCKNEAEALEKLMWLRAKDTVGRHGKRVGVVADEPEVFDFEGLSQCCHVYAAAGGGR